jgi:4-diphosphocytidyl-2-C-methyl-D-erythritol kinase
MMTGSGACVFAEFPSQAAAQKVLLQLPQGMEGVVVQGLAQHPLRDFVA